MIVTPEEKKKKRRCKAKDTSGEMEHKITDDMRRNGGKTMDLSTAKIKINRWLIIMFLGFNFGFSYEPPYIRYTFHEELTTVCGYTDTQLGLMLSVYGTLALLFYVVGGVSADKFSCRKLIVISLMGTSVGCGIMALYPPFWVALLVEALWVVTTIGLLWSPTAKVAALLGTKQEESKIFPMLSSFEGVGAMVTTFCCTFVFGMIGAESNVDSLRYVWVVYAVFGIVLAVVSYLVVPEKTLYKEEAKEKVVESAEDKAARKKENRSVLVQVLKNPMTYIAAFIVLGSYIVYSCLTYTQSYLCDIYGMDMTTASYFSIVRNQMMKIIAGPLSIVIMSAAILKSSPTRLCVVTSVLSAIGLGATLLMPLNPEILVVVMGLAIILSFVALLAKAQNFACTGETGVDPKIFGTMTGVVSLIGYSSDMWIYVVIGRWQETLEPVMAYNRVWYLALAGCVLLFISGTALLLKQKSMKNQKQLEA